MIYLPASFACCGMHADAGGVEIAAGIEFLLP